MARKIRIHWATSRYTLGRDDAVRVRIEVACADGLPSDKIFAYRLLPKNPKTGSKRGFFSHICSPADLEDYPEDEPIPTHVPPWFRLSYVDVLLRSTTEAEAFIEDVRSDIRRLLRSLKAVDAVFFTGEDNFGSNLVCASSSSSFSSASAGSDSSSASLGPLQSLKSVGSFEQGVGPGVIWTPIGAGAGSPIGSSDSLDALTRNLNRTSLQPGLVSKILLIQGYDFSDLPSDASLEGLVARLIVRDASLLGSSLSASPSLSSSSSSIAAAVQTPLLGYFRLYDPDRGFVGDDKSNNTPIFGPDWQILDFGGQSDLWNAGISASTLRRRGDFGLGLIVFLPEDVTDSIVDVDGVEIEIFYR